MSVMSSKRRSSTPKHARPHDHAKLPQCGMNGNTNFSWIETEDLACLLTDFEMPLYDEALSTPPPPPRPYHTEEPPPTTSPESSIGTFLPIVVLRGDIGLSKWILVSTSTAYWGDKMEEKKTKKIVQNGTTRILWAIAIIPIIMMLLPWRGWWRMEEEACV